MKIVAGLLVLGLSLPAIPGDQREKPEDYQLAIDTFVRCAGLYEWAAQAMQLAGKPNAAEHMRGMRRGAKTTASWFAANRYMLEHPDKPPRPIGAWDAMLDPQIETEITRVKGLSELGDTETIDSAMNLCAEASKVQADVVNSIRKNIAERANAPTATGSVASDQP